MGTKNLEELEKNAKIVIPVFVLIAIGFLVLSHFLGKHATHHIVYQNSISAAQSNPSFDETIGLPLKSHKHTSYSLRNNTTARYTIKVIGSKSSGTLFVYSERNHSNWEFKQLELRHRQKSYNLLK